MSERVAAQASQLPAVGLSANAPARPTATAAFPAVHDLPAPRNSVILNAVEQSNFEREMTTVRDSQQTAAGTKKAADASAAAAKKPSLRGKGKPGEAPTPAADAAAPKPQRASGSAIY